MARPNEERVRKRRLADLDELAGWLLRDSKRLLRRHGGKLAADARGELEASRQRLELATAKASGERDIDALEHACDALDHAMDRHLLRYRKSPTREYVEAVGGAILLALLIRAFVFEAFKIPTGSMIPTLHVHDHLFVNKFLYGLKIPFTRVRLFGVRTPQRGEIVVFEYPFDDDPESSGKDLIKRVIGVPGDRIRLQDNRIYVNGKPLQRKILDPVGDCGEAVELVRPCPDGDGQTCLYAGSGETQLIARFPNAEAALDRVSEIEGFRCTSVRECDAGSAWTSQFRVATAGRDGGYYGAVNDPTWPPAGFDAQRFGPHARRYLPPDNADWPEVVIPEGQLLMMGDNRDNSKDGRFFGLVPFEVVKGKAGFIWYAYERDFWKPDFSRIGTVVHRDAEAGECE